jgi:hypothetical protein
MRVKFAEIVEHWLDRLTPSPDGKKKVFKETMVGNLKEFIQNFADLNITDDAALEKLVGQAQSLVAGKSVDALRKDDAVRASVQDGMAKLKEMTDKMLTDRPNRAIAIIDDEEDEKATDPTAAAVPA